LFKGDIKIQCLKIVVKEIVIITTNGIALFLLTLRIPISKTNTNKNAKNINY